MLNENVEHVNNIQGLKEQPLNSSYQGRCNNHNQVDNILA